MARKRDEVIYHKGFVGPDGAPLSGDHAYTLHFTKDQLPAHYATYFWSVTAVDAVHRRVLPTAEALPPQQGVEAPVRQGRVADAVLRRRETGIRTRRQLAPDPKGQRYSLKFRFYRPKGGVADHTYFPPSLVEL